MKVTRMMFAVFALAWVAAAQALPEIKSWSTPGGTKVLFVEAPELPMVDIRVVFDAGGARDADRSGIARLTNALLDQGAAGKNADQIARGFEDRGASIGGGSERDMAWLSLRSLTDDKLLQPSLALFASVLTRPDFPVTDFERERQRMLTGLQYQKQKPQTIASRKFYRGLYGDHPYAGDPSGSEEALQALSVDAIRAYYKRYYVARNATLVMVGDLSEKKARAIAEDLLDDLPAGEAAPALPAVDLPGEADQVFIEYPASQSHVLMGMPGMRRQDPDYFALYVGNHILGGSGLVSRISDEIREKRGLSYSAYSYFIPMKHEGPYQLGLQTRNDQRDEALQVLRDTLSAFRDKGPTKKELASAKNNIIGGFPMRVSSNGKIAEYLAVIGFYDLPLDYLSRFTDRVNAITTKQIRDAYQRRVQPDRMFTVVVGGPPESDPDS